MWVSSVISLGLELLWWFYCRLLVLIIKPWIEGIQDIRKNRKLNSVLGVLKVSLHLLCICMFWIAWDRLANAVLGAALLPDLNAASLAFSSCQTPAVISCLLLMYHRILLQWQLSGSFLPNSGLWFKNNSSVLRRSPLVLSLHWSSLFQKIFVGCYHLYRDVVWDG